MKLLLVCTGNICRSPTAAGVLQRLAHESGLSLSVDSAGTHDYHVGEPPDERAQEHARRRGYDLSRLRARQIAQHDFAAFDLVLALDRGHLSILERLCPREQRHKLRMLMDFAPAAGVRDVPDPYYGGPEDFEKALDLIEAASRGLIGHLRDHLRVST
ncbi:MAG: low molecular weight protein-tyrosine-phosphatase [Burkholderiales bacterium]